MKAKIDRRELKILADELEEEVRVLTADIACKQKDLEIKKQYAKAARDISTGMEFGVIK